MNDIVAVAVRLQGGSERYFLTWGRIQDAVDPRQLEAIVLQGSAGFSLGDVAVSARVCRQIGEAAEEPYFYEAFFELCQRRIPFGPGYEEWRVSVDARMREGKDLWFLG